MNPVVITCECALAYGRDCSLCRGTTREIITPSTDYHTLADELEELVADDRKAQPAVQMCTSVHDTLVLAAAALRELSDVRARLTLVTKQRDTARAVAEELHAEQGDADADLTALHEHLAAVEAERDEALAEVARVRAVGLDVVDLHQQAKGAAELNKETIVEMHQHVRDLRSALAAKDREIAKLKAAPLRLVGGDHG